MANHRLGLRGNPDYRMKRPTGSLGWLRGEVPSTWARTNSVSATLRRMNRQYRVRSGERDPAPGHKLPE